jgi:hypothetical protein
MERRNSLYRFASLALVAAAAACDGAGSSSGSDVQRQVLAECSMSVPADSTALELQRTVDSVLTGMLDPCGSGVDLSRTRFELMRLDADEQGVQVIFRAIAKAVTPGTVPASAAPNRNLLERMAPQRQFLH